MSAIIAIGKALAGEGEKSDGKNDIHNDTFDVTVEDVGKYSIGNEVEITIKGCVGMISIPPEAGFGNPRIGVKVYSQEIRKTGNVQIEEIRKLVEGDLSTEGYSDDDYED